MMDATDETPQQLDVAQSSDGTAQDRILLSIATFNEMESLPELVRRLRHLLPEAQLLIVDDNSPDGTGKWVNEQSKQDAQIRAIHRSHKMGLGTAALAALQYAVEHDFTYVISLDADGSHDPKYIPAMLTAIGSNGPSPPDMVIGSRYVPGGGSTGWPWYRHMMSRGVNLYARVMLGLPVHDCSGAFRCIRVAFLREVDLTNFQSQGFSFMEELLWRCKLASARFCEIPIIFANRTRGKSKINMRESFTSLWTLTRLGVKNWLRIG